MKHIGFSGFVALMALSSCGPREKPVLPVVARIDGAVKALSNEEAETVCRTHECEPNQLYTASFGRKHHSTPPAPVPVPVREPATPPGPVPTTAPAPLNPQPAEADDYSRGIMNVQPAWNVSQGSRDVIVAVIDTGVSYTHPDLYENMWVNEAEKNGRPGVDDDGNGYVDDVYGWDFYNNRPNGFDDGAGHGTHCAGIIGAVDNSIGIRGVSPRVKIMPLKFLSAAGSGDTADAVSAINYAIKMGANVLSNSWGGGGYSQFLADAIAQARAKGMVFVAAAGNNSANNDTSPSYPASYSGVVSVGSTDSSDNLSSFSNYGAGSVKILAPGSSIRSTYLNDTYRIMSGTSMATPQVSGAIALAFAVKPALTEAEIKSDLCESASKRLLSYNQCGRIDVGEFIRRVSTR